MSRSGYCDDVSDTWAHIRWRGAVTSAFRGKRGQEFLRDLLAALDAMPEKRLIGHSLECADGVCALGALGKARGLDMSGLDPEDPDGVAGAFGVADPLIREIVFHNDEAFSEEWDSAFRRYSKATPERRWELMRAWVASKIKPVPAEIEVAR